MQNTHMYRGLGLLLLRLAVGGIFLMHAIAKLLSLQQTIHITGTMGGAMLLVWIIAAIEIIAGTLILLGLYVRHAGYTLATLMLLVIIFAKWSTGFAGMEIEFLLIASTLTIAWHGPGKYSLNRGCACPECAAKGCSCAGHGTTCGCGDCGVATEQKGKCGCVCTMCSMGR